MITRNPLDVITSWFYLLNTGSHSLYCKEVVNQAFPAEWDEFVRNYIVSFKEWHKYIVDELAPKVPVHYMRFEDMT